MSDRTATPTGLWWVLVNAAERRLDFREKQDDLAPSICGFRALMAHEFR